MATLNGRITATTKAGSRTAKKQSKSLRRYTRTYTAEKVKFLTAERGSRLSEERKVKNYKIQLELSEANVKVLLDSLEHYKGNAQLVASCITACIKTQISIQNKSEGD